MKVPNLRFELFAALFSSLAILSVFAPGCSFDKTPEAAPLAVPVAGQPAPVAMPTSQPAASAWDTKIETNGELATYTRSSMNADERERVRDDVSRSTITTFNSRSGYTIYKINGSERFERNAFIMPKVLVIGSVDGGRASLRVLPNGQVALTFPIALIDGSQRELPYSTTRIRLSDSLYLDDAKRAAIKRELADAFGYEHELASLGVCPNRIVIKIAGVDNDVTPRVFGGPGGPTGCQPNQPFTVTLQGDRKYIERFLSDDVFNGAAEIAAMYEIAGSYVDEVRLYQLKIAGIYSHLKGQLVDVSDKGIVKKELSQADADQTLILYVQRALGKWAANERFIEKVKGDALAQLKIVLFDEKAAGTDKDKGPVLVIKDEAAFKALDVSVRVVNESLGRRGEVFYSTSIIKPILNSTNIAIRGEERQDLTRPPGSGVVQDIFTVRQGEEYELQLSSVVVHEYEFSDEQSQPKIEDKGLVCLDKPGETLPACRKYKNECIEQKNFCKKPKAGCVRYGEKVDCNTSVNVSLGGCLTLGIFGSCGIDRECKPVPDLGNCIEYGAIGCEDWGNYCAQTHQICEPGYDDPLCKNQITDLRITKYFSAPAPVNNRVINAPLGNTDQDIIGNLTLRFRWPDGKTIDCLALALLKEVVGQSIRFKIKNNAYCKPFPDGYEGSPVLSVLNRISSQRKDIPCGVMNFSTVEGTKYYGCNGYNAVDLTPDQHNGGDPARPSSFSRSPLYLTYFPVVDLNGILISRTGGISSGDTREGQWAQ